MEVWAWILAYVVGFALLQLLVYRYFKDREASADRGPMRSGERTAFPSVEGSERGSDPEDRDPDDGVYCQHCGAYNARESTFRYCQECVSPLQ